MLVKAWHMQVGIKFNFSDLQLPLLVSQCFPSHEPGFNPIRAL